MATQTSPNNARAIAEFNLFSPRNGGRGAAKKSTGAIGVVTWVGGQVKVDGTNVFALAEKPNLLDIAFDQLDRPQISWITSAFETFIYFFDGTLPGYRTLSVGTNAADPAVCNDYRLEGGVNTVLLYLKDGFPTYRIQADRFTMEYLLTAQQVVGIKNFGYGVGSNSIQLVIGIPHDA